MNKQEERMGGGGSGLPRHALIDARGIFCAYVCRKCEAKKRAGFRPDIFTDANYWTDEPIESEEY